MNTASKSQTPKTSFGKQQKMWRADLTQVFGPICATSSAEQTFLFMDDV